MLTEPKRVHTSRSTTQPLYTPLDGMLVRAPAYPIEAYQSLHASAQAADLDEGDPRVRLILASGSLSLLDDLTRRAKTDKEREHRRAKVLRYLIRMATRPTPFGLFAGVALGEWGDTTTLTLHHTPPQTATRPDMHWLMTLIQAMEAIPEIRRSLRFRANTAALEQGGRLYLHEQALSDTPLAPVSVRATRVAHAALHLARQPIAYQDLAQQLLDSFSAATPEKVDSVLDELWRQTFLLSELRPVLVGASPVQTLLHHIQTIPTAQPFAEYIATVVQALAEWDADPAHQTEQRYRHLHHMLSETPKASPALAHSQVASAPHADQRTDQLLQIDMMHSLAEKTLSRTISEEVARAAEVLLRLSAVPHGQPFLDDYRQAFIERYGLDRDVPLLEVLDSNAGLGYPPAYSAAPVSIKPLQSDEFPRRQAALMDLALTAWRERQRVVELDDAIVQQLTTASPSPTNAPLSLDIIFSVAAPSASAIDDGHFQIILGSNIATIPARNTSGRFAHLLGDAGQKLITTTAHQQEAFAWDKIWAELTYLPLESRLANVAIHPAARRYEIIWGTEPATDAMSVIPLDEIALGIRQGRFALLWSARHAEIVVCSGHMLNHLRAPGIVRFLTDVGHDRALELTGFSWGPAHAFPFLPRVQYGRSILRLAQWNINATCYRREWQLATAESFFASLQTWRQRWDVPRYVYLSELDNRLSLDLEAPLQVEDIRTTLRTARDDQEILMQECIPTPDCTWVEGPGGHFATEFVVSLMLRSHADTPLEAPSATLRRSHLPPEDVPRTSRLHPPGGEWVFMKLYCGTRQHEALIVDAWRAVVQRALSEQWIDSWFFVRYADPEPHLRLRFHGLSERLNQDLLPCLCAWGKQLVLQGHCQQFVFATYDREIERYGGIAGVGLAESIFSADSQAVAEMFEILAQKPVTLDRTLLAVLSTDHFLAALGADPLVQLAGYQQRATRREATGMLYRRNSATLRTLLGDPFHAQATIPAYAHLAAILDRRSQCLALPAQQLMAAAEDNQLTQPLTAIYSSYIHMHCNRILGIEREKEEDVVGLLVRTRESLRIAPIPTAL